MCRWFICLLLGLPFVMTHAAEGPRAFVAQRDFDFGRVTDPGPIRHEFRMVNTGTAPLRIERAALTPPLRLEAMRAEIAPGAEARLRISLSPVGLSGRFDGRVVLFTNDPVAPEITLSVEGEVVPPIELSPMPELFVATVRGRGAVASIDIVNHEALPLELAVPRHSVTRFSSTLEPVEPGRRYRLSIALKPDGPAGRHREDITIATSSRSMPVLVVGANTLLRERVYTFPETVDLGALPLTAVRADPDLLRRNAQVLMVYQDGGRDFHLSASSDVAGLSIAAERAATGDRYQLTIALEPTPRPAARTLRGTILIRTNDPDFPALRVPVSGALLRE